MTTSESAKNAAEEFLFEQGAFAHRSEQRRSLLGCMACQWQRSLAADGEPIAYGYQIMQCTGIKGGTLYPSLRRLEDAGALSSYQEVETSDAGKPRRYYSPASTNLGLGLAYHSTETFEDCRYGMSPDKREVPAKEIIAADLLVAASDRSGLEYLIAKAMQKLDALDKPPQ